ncbi:MAG: ATP-binding protein [Verrucomicrobiota bacterium]
MTTELHLKLVSRIETISDLNAGIDEFAEKNRLERSVVFDLRLVLEELIVNIIHYAFEDAKEGYPIDVLLASAKYGEAVSVTIEDGGLEFDPTEEIPTNLPGASPDGGFGIFLVSQKTRDLKYERIEGKRNRVSFWVDCGKR